MTTSEDTAIQELRYEATLELSGQRRGILLATADTAGLAYWNEDWLVREQLGAEEGEVYFMFACFLLLAIGDDNF